MVICDLDDMHVTLAPFEANPPLAVDANAVLACASAMQRFEAVRPQLPQVLQRGGVVEDLQAPDGLTLEVLEILDTLAIEKTPRTAGRGTT